MICSTASLLPLAFARTALRTLHLMQIMFAQIQGATRELANRRSSNSTLPSPRTGLGDFGGLLENNTVLLGFFPPLILLSSCLGVDASPMRVGHLLFVERGLCPEGLHAKVQSFEAVLPCGGQVFG